MANGRDGGVSKNLEVLVTSPAVCTRSESNLRLLQYSIKPLSDDGGVRDAADLLITCT
jgi:hypothetical protein